jgi:hypothetical protein
MKNAGIFILGFVCGAAALLLLLTVSASRSPPTPNLKPPESITVLLYPPWTRPDTPEAVIVPAKRHGDVFRRLIPETYYGEVTGDYPPIVADAKIAHPDETQTRVLVREGGKNPAVVSVDGIHYFYAKNEPDLFAGATELIRIVRELDYQKQNQTKTE